MQTTATISLISKIPRECKRKDHVDVSMMETYDLEERVIEGEALTQFDPIFVVCLLVLWCRRPVRTEAGLFVCAPSEELLVRQPFFFPAFLSSRFGRHKLEANHLIWIVSRAYQSSSYSARSFYLRDLSSYGEPDSERFCG